MSEALESFVVDIADDVITDLHDRLARTRWPSPSPDGAWGYGTELGYLQELCEYWRTTFDWRVAERRLNSWPQVVTEIDGERVHAIHARSPEPDAFPLVMTHGWPGSVAEFLELIDPLRDPRSHGGDPADAFHVVCPSIPGYGFSGPTHQPGWHVVRVAAAVAELMARLGYDRYGAQGGDWGAITTMNLAANDAADVAGIHVNMMSAAPPDRDNPHAGLSAAELAGLADAAAFQEREAGYQAIQRTKPQTLGYGLNDSPAGLAGWIVEKFRTWSDCNGDVESKFTKDQLLTNIMIYWVTGTISSSTRLYYETASLGRSSTVPGRWEVPTGVALFPKEIMRFPRAWVANRCNLTHWTEMPSGGHFAAMEEPARLIDDVRAFFRTVR